MREEVDHRDALHINKVITTKVKKNDEMIDDLEVVDPALRELCPAATH